MKNLLQKFHYTYVLRSKREDYPTDNSQWVDIIEDSSNYYRFQFQGSGYSAQGIYKVVSGSTTDSSTETGTINSDETQFTIDSILYFSR